MVLMVKSWKKTCQPHSDVKKVLTEYLTLASLTLATA